MEAATVLLDIASLLSQEPGQESRVRALCAQLATVFSRTTMPKEALHALDHLRREAIEDAPIGDLLQVRNFFRHLRDAGADAVFVPGH